jgi:hypothetical protein
MKFCEIVAAANKKQLRFEINPFFCFNHFWGEMRFPDRLTATISLQTFHMTWPTIRYIGVTGKMMFTLTFLFFYAQVELSGRGKRDDAALVQMTRGLKDGKKTIEDVAGEIVKRANDNVNPPEG